MTVIYLIRHGQSEWNQAGRIQGRSESPLTDLGREQAKALAPLLRETLPETEFDIVSSPLGRAYETALIIARDLGRAEDSVHTDERITDFDVGILSGYPGWDAVASDHPALARLRLQDPLRFSPPDGESGADVVRRVEQFLAARDASANPAVVVCHGVINKFIRAVRRGITGAAIIELGEEQNVVYRLDGTEESELRAQTVNACP